MILQKYDFKSFISLQKKSTPQQQSLCQAHLSTVKNNIIL